MDKQQAQTIIKETFEKSFNKDRFNGFIKNLLNQIEDAPFSYQGNYIPDAYKPFISRYERIGKYNDGEKRIDILIVYLNRRTSIERARTRQRNFIAGYLDGKYGSDVSKDAALVAFVSPNEEDWRFSLVKMDYRFEQARNGKVKVKDEFTPARRWSFLVGKNESSHTAQSRLVPRLADDEHNPTLAQMEEAFNIEKVTKEFFGKYRELFLWTKETLDKIVKQDAKIEADFEAKGVNTIGFAKKLLGQVVFLYFLQRKGWFGVERDAEWGTGTKQFLRELFQGKHGKYGNFFNDILEPLFYEALRIDRRHDDDYYSRFNCKIPFLNGGLFDPIGGYDWVHTDILLPNELFSNQNKTKEGDTGNGILDIFDRYNFTVKEDEPLEKEVAVDPEMLGKVFENLLEVKDRKSKGSYYTPREIVHYMCQQSLINYLNTELNKGVTLYQNIGDLQTNAFGNEAKIGQLDLTVKRKSGQQISKEDLEILIEYGEYVGENEATVVSKGRETDTYFYKLSENIRKNAKLIDEKLASIKVCDPAIGSGAFPVGMMHEIVKTRNVLTTFLSLRGAQATKQSHTGDYFADARDDNRTIYHFKRECIEKSLYGVDIDPGAVEIAKLRLWLSLVVDEEDINQIKPLPNLDYKIVCGNSLLGYPYTPMGLEKIEKSKELFFYETRPKEKNELREQINHSIYDLFKSTEESLAYRVTVDFKINFSEVFHEKGGFDVVIANPPYVRADSGDDYLEFRGQLEKSGMYETLYEKWDLFIPFIERGLNILNREGGLIFITSDSLCTAKYAHKLLEMILRKHAMHSIDYFENMYVFDAGVTPVVLHIDKKGIADSTRITIRENSFDTIKSTKEIARGEFRRLGKDAFRKNFISLNLKVKTENLGNICYISYGLRPNSDERFWKGEFKTKDVVSDKKSDIYCRPFVEGKDIDAYKIKRIRHLEWGTARVPAKISRPTFPELYTPPKIIRGRMNPAIYDDTETVCSANAIVLKRLHDLRGVDNRSIRNSFKNNRRDRKILESISIKYDLKYLLAILNSIFAYFYLNNIRRHKMENYFYPDDLKKLPIRIIALKDQKPFINLVDRILAITKDEDYLQNPQKQSQVKALEQEIDQMVYQLYGLTEEEIRTVEGDK